MKKRESACPKPDVRTGTGLERWVARAIATLLLVLLAAPALAVSPYDRWAEDFGIDPNVSYDGKRVMEFQGGQFDALERRAPGKMYMEMFIGGMTSGVILREDLQKSYILLPSMGYYKEDSLEGGLNQAANGLEFSEIEKVGREDVIGYPSTKYKAKFKDNEGKGAGFIWVADAGVPIKFEMIYSNKDAKGQRINMHFTELNLREQDPAYFELPANLKPMNMGNLGGMMQMGGTPPAASGTAPAAATGSSADLPDRQQACLQEAAARAEEKRKASETKKGFARLVGSVARTANRFGVGDMGKVTRGIYDANATADDVAVIADELGITEEDVERCREPG